MVTIIRIVVMALLACCCGKLDENVLEGKDKIKAKRGKRGMALLR